MEQCAVHFSNELCTGNRFCSGQSYSYSPDTFGTNRGFEDEVYIMGEEIAVPVVTFSPLIPSMRTCIVPSEVHAPGGTGGMHSTILVIRYSYCIIIFPEEVAC